MREPFDDPVLGRVTWVPEPLDAWQCSLALPSGRTIPVYITPDDSRKPLHDQEGLEDLKVRVRWIVDNEQAKRTRIAERMFPAWQQDRYDEEIDMVTTIEGFRDAISLDGINFFEDNLPRLNYQDGGLFGGHAIEATLEADGSFKYEPQFWG
jgi:hypothetical protein